MTKRPGEPGYEWYVAWRYLGRDEKAGRVAAGIGAGIAAALVIHLLTGGVLAALPQLERWFKMQIPDGVRIGAAAVVFLGGLIASAIVLHRHVSISYFFVGLGLFHLLAGGGCLAAAQWLHTSALEDAYFGRTDRRRILQLAGMGGLLLGYLLTYVGLIASRFSVFTVISMFGVFLGVAAPIIVLSVMSGFETDLKQKILGQHAHVTITEPDKAWTGWEDDIRKIRGVGGVKGATPYLESEVLIYSQTMNQGAEFRGIEPQSIGQVTDLARDMEIGELPNLEHPEEIKPALPPILDDDDDQPKKKAEPAPPPPPPPSEAPKKSPPGIILGTELAKNLRVYVGDDVTVACLACGMGPTGPIPNQRKFRVAGIFKTGMYEFDMKIAYTNLPAAQKFLSLPGEISGIEVKTTNINHADEVADHIRAALGNAHLEVKDWREMNRSLFSALKMEKIAMFIVLAFIILVASFSIISTLIMIVVEKASEIAILKSMGATDRGVIRIFLSQGLYIGGIGLAAGLLMGLGACSLLGRFGLSLDAEVYYIAKLPVHIDVFEILAISACAVGISCLATLYPAWLAARLRPVEGLRYE